MNTRRIVVLAALLTGVVSVLCFTHPGIAQVTYQWDPGQTGTGSDGPGNWDFASNNWDSGGSVLTWSDSNDAVFGAHKGAAGTVTLTGQVTPNSITFNPAASGNYVLTSGAISLPNPSTSITVNSSATISSPLVGSGGLSVAGAGTLTLSAVNSYSGATTIGSGSKLLIGNVPLALPNLASGTLDRWYDATDVNNGGPAPADGAALTAWLDKSPNGVNAVCTGAGGPTDGVGTPIYVATGSNTINGRPAIWFGANGGQNNFGFSTAGMNSNSSPSTMFVVGQLSGYSNNWGWMAAYGSAGGGLARGIGTTPTSNLLDYTVWGTDVQGPALNANPPTPVVADCVYGGTGNSVQGTYIYNGITGTVSANPVLTTGIDGGHIGSRVDGAYEFWDGSVGEVVIYDGALSDADRQVVESYLNYKWLLAANNAAVLPSTTDVSISSGGTLDLGGNTQQIRSLSGSGIVTNSGGSDATLVVDGPLSPSLFGGVLSDGPTNKLWLNKAGDGTLVLLNANTYTGATLVSGGTLQIGNGGSGASIGGTSGVTLSNNATLAFDHADAVTFAPAIGGVGNLYKTGTGTLTLTATESYAGSTTVDQGMLTLATAASNILPIATPVTLSAPATLNLNGGNQQLASLSDGNGSGSVINGKTASASVLTISPIDGSTSVFSGTIQGGGTLGTISLVMSGSGTQVLAGNNSYTGGTQLLGGELALAGSGALPPTGAISFAGGALQAANATDYSPRFSNAPGQAYSIDTNGQTVTWATALTSSGGSLTKLGAGTLILTGANTYSGTTNVNGGILEPTTTASLPGYNAPNTVNVAGGATLAVPVGGRGDWTYGQIDTLAANGNFNTSGALGIDTSHGSSTYSGAFTQPLTLNKLGPNGLTLTGANTNAGGAIVTAGTLQLGNGATGNDGSLTGNIVNNSALVYNLHGTQTYRGSIIGSGGITKTGPGTLVLSGLATYTGPTVVSGGILRIQPSNSLPNIVGSGISLQRWYDAFDVNNGGSPPNDGDTLTSWSDKSGNGVNAVCTGAGGPTDGVGTPTYVATGSNTINGHPAIYFGGNSNFGFSMAGMNSGNSPSTMFVVGQISGYSNNWGWMAAYGTGGTGNARGIGTTPNTNLLDYTVWQGDVQGPALNANPPTPVVAGCVFGSPGGDSMQGNYFYNGTTGTVSLNPVLTTASSGGHIGSRVDGAYEFWDGSVGEVLIYNGALSPAQEQLVESYLERKWILGSAGTLPTTTPVTISQGATLDLTDVMQTIGSLSSTDGMGSKVLLGGNGVLTVGDSSTTTFDGTISGLGGSLVKQGAGTLVLSGSNTYGGTTSVNAGTLIPITTAALPGYATLNQVNVGSGATITVPVGGAGDWTGSQITSLASNATWTDNTSVLGIDTTHGSATYSGALTQALVLNKLGPNMLTLTGSNTNAGGAIVTAGTLQLGNGATGNDGSLTGNIVNNAALVYNLHGSQTYGGSIIGSGGLTKTGPGTLVLTGPTAYAGPTVISGGILKAQPIIALPSVTGVGISLQRWYDAADVNNGGPPPNDGDILTSWSDKSGNGVNAVCTGAGGPTDGVGTPTYVATGTNTINGHPAIYFGGNSNFGFSMAGMNSGSSPSTMFVVGQISSYSNGWGWMAAYGTSGTGNARGIGQSPANVLDYTVWGGDVQGPALNDNPPTPVVAACVYGGPGASMQGSYYYDGTTGSVSLNPVLTTASSGGHIGSRVDGGYEFWDGSVGEVVIYNGALSPAQEQLVESYLEQKWILGPVGNLPTTTPVIISQGATLDLTDVRQTIGSLSSTDGLGSNVLLGSVGVLTVGDSTTTTFDGTISGPGGSLFKQGAGTLVLTGSNTYGGGTTVSQGVLTYYTRASQPTSGTTAVAAGATLGLGVGSNPNLFGSTDVDQMFAGTFPRVSSDPNSSVGIDTSAGNFTYASNIPATTLGLNKLGPNVLTLTGSNSYTGPTTITGGSLQLGDGTAPHDGIALTGNIVNNAALIYNLHGNQTYGGVISGSGGMTKTGPGTLVLSGYATYSGPTIISGGTLKIPNIGLPNVSGAGITLQRWYDAADVNNGGAPPADGSTVSTWSDKSSNAVNAICTGAGGLTDGVGTPIYVASGSNTINGHPAIWFGANGGQNNFGFSTAGMNSGSSPSTMFVVGQLSGYSNNWGWMAAYGTAGGGNARSIGQNPSNVLDFSTWATDVPGPALNANPPTPVVAACVYGGPGNSLQGTYIYNGTTGTVSANPVLATGTGGGHIGSRVDGPYEFWDGPVGEVVIYDGALSADQQQAVETYLQRKWVGTLPPTTPVTISQGATLDLTNVTQTIGSLSSTDGLGSKVLLGSGALTVGDATSTTFDGAISGLGGSLLKQGTGTLVLSGSNSYAGGTTVNGGELVATSSTALPDGTSLTVGAGGTFVFDPSQAGSPAVGAAAVSGAAAVPEPGTLALLVAGLVAGFGVWRRTRARISI